MTVDLMYNIYRLYVKHEAFKHYVGAKELSLETSCLRMEVIYLNKIQKKTKIHTQIQKCVNHQKLFVKLS